MDNSILKISNPYFDSNIRKSLIAQGNFIYLKYKIIEGKKERIQSYEGLIISMQNRGESKTFTLKYIIQGITVEQTFFFNSPKIIFIHLIKKYKIRRSKLFYNDII